MNQLRIGIVTLSGSGHVYPILPLCSELATRGHRVTFGTTDRYAHQISEAGAKPLIVNCDPPDKKLIDAVERTFQLSCEDAEYCEVAMLFQAYQFAFAEQLAS
jgi:hypothetical protein